MNDHNNYTSKRISKEMNSESNNVIRHTSFDLEVRPDPSNVRSEDPSAEIMQVMDILNNHSSLTGGRQIDLFLRLHGFLQKIHAMIDPLKVLFELLLRKASSMPLYVLKAVGGLCERLDKHVEALKGVDVVVEEGAAQAGTLGAEAVEGASTWLTLGRFVSKALIVAAFLATIGGLIYDGVEGHKQMEQCRE